MACKYKIGNRVRFGHTRTGVITNISTTNTGGCNYEINGETRVGELAIDGYAGGARRRKASRRHRSRKQRRYTRRR
jgi:hypothetical protein